MCFFNAQNKRAFEIAKRYGRQTDLAEAVREIIEEQKLHKAYLNPDCFMVTTDEQLQAAKWGLIPSWVREVGKAESIRKMTANAQSETVFTLPSFREAIKKRRCLIPSTGFYEYHHISAALNISASLNNRISTALNNREAIPYRIFLRDTEVFSLAGVYEDWRNPDTKETVRTFSVLTVPANELCGFIHNGGRNPGRMPAILPVMDEEKWLNPRLTEDEIKGLLIPYETGLMDCEVLEKDFLRRA